MRIIARRQHIHRRWSGFYATLLCAGLTAYAAGAEIVLKRGNGSDPETLDPHLTQGIPGARVEADLFEGLTVFAADGRAIPGAAKSWDVSEGGTVYTFHLHHNSRWSNGDPVTAHDFEFAWKRIVDPATAAPFSTLMNSVLNAEDLVRGKIKGMDKLGVKALDDYTFQVILERPTPYFPSEIPSRLFFPLHEKSLRELGNQWTRAGNLISNGPYKFVAWKPQDYIKLVKNEYFREAGQVRIAALAEMA